MAATKFIDLPREEQLAEVRGRFQFRQGSGWYTTDGLFAGQDEGDVIAALIDLEDAEINAVGDCMTGCCLMQPKFEDFVRTPHDRNNRGKTGPTEKRTEK